MFPADDFGRPRDCFQRSSLNERHPATAALEILRVRWYKVRPRRGGLDSP